MKTWLAEALSKSVFCSAFVKHTQGCTTCNRAGRDMVLLKTEKDFTRPVSKQNLLQTVCRTSIILKVLVIVGTTQTTSHI